MQKMVENMAVAVEYEELLRYCPMLAVDPETAQSLDGYTLHVLSLAARGSVEDRREIQRQGIQRAKAHGVQFGRPALEIPGNFGEIVEAWQDGRITGQEAIRQSGVSQSTFYRRLKKLREKA